MSGALDYTVVFCQRCGTFFNHSQAHDCAPKIERAFRSKRVEEKPKSDTPRTDAEETFGDNFGMNSCVSDDFARQLERELNASNDRIKRLEKAGDELELWCEGDEPCKAWKDAKKPLNDRH